jgi:hypothetical protein
VAIFERVLLECDQKSIFLPYKSTWQVTHHFFFFFFFFFFNSAHYFQDASLLCGPTLFPTLSLSPFLPLTSFQALSLHPPFLSPFLPQPPLRPTHTLSLSLSQNQKKRILSLSPSSAASLPLSLSLVSSLRPENPCRRQRIPSDDILEAHSPSLPLFLSQSNLSIHPSLSLSLQCSEHYYLVTVTTKTHLGDLTQ